MADPDETGDEPSIVSSSFQFGSGGLTIDDAVHPTAIRHEVDEINIDGALSQRYNYLEYEFTKDGLFCRARCYLHSVHEVAFFGPFAGRVDLSPVRADDIRTDVLDYLKRRFDLITELGDDSYVTHWSRSR